MKEDAINIAIAEVSGWKLRSNGESPMWAWVHPDMNSPIRWKSKPDMAAQNVLPDYCNDLNAMHDAEKTLDDRWEAEPPRQCVGYGEILEKICAPRNAQFGIITATARQRAQAFLRTLNKWEET